jgi:hypothetical protein
MASPHSAKGAPPTGNAPQSLATTNGQQTFKRTGGRGQALTVVGAIGKGNGAQLRVGVSRWRDQVKVELRECSLLMAELHFPVGTRVTLDIEGIPQLIRLLELAAKEGGAR